MSQSLGVGDLRRVADPALAAFVQLSLAGPLPTPDSPSASPPMTLCAFGMNLQAATTADGRDRKQLERICRYLLVPPFAHDSSADVDREDAGEELGPGDASWPGGGVW